jgi:hypothetical protein
MTLVLAICETCPAGEVDGMISVLLNIFDTRESVLTLIKVMIDREIGRTGWSSSTPLNVGTNLTFSESEAALFRSNSTYTRFLGAFARVHGYNYLRNLVGPLIKCMQDMPSGYELDPAKAGPDQDVEHNRSQVEHVARSFLQILDVSTKSIPPYIFCSTSFSIWLIFCTGCSVTFACTSRKLCTYASLYVWYFSHFLQHEPLA